MRTNPNNTWMYITYIEILEILCISRNGSHSKLPNATESKSQNKTNNIFDSRDDQCNVLSLLEIWFGIIYIFLNTIQQNEISGAWHCPLPLVKSCASNYSQRIENENLFFFCNSMNIINSIINLE